MTQETSTNSCLRGVVKSSLNTGRVSLCFTLELSDNKRETGARAREREKIGEDRRGDGRATGKRGGKRESIIYTAASCRPDYFNFFLSFPPPSSLFLPSPTIVQLSATAKVVLCRGRDRLFKCPPSLPHSSLFLPFFVLMSATTDKKRGGRGWNNREPRLCNGSRPTERSNDRPLVSEVR